jgi:ElaB/YqjD/DUF883 family membrane-anchored ribosome-binding protein
MQAESQKQDSATNGQGVGSSVLPATGQALSGIALEFQNVLSDLEDLMKATTSLTGDDLVRTKEKLGERIAAARESVGKVGGAIVHRARTTAVVTNDFVHEQPWKALGVGAIVGFLLGVVISRRS